MVIWGTVIIANFTNSPGKHLWGSCFIVQLSVLEFQADFRKRLYLVPCEKWCMSNKKTPKISSFKCWVSLFSVIPFKTYHRHFKLEIVSKQVTLKYKLKDGDINILQHICIRVKLKIQSCISKKHWQMIAYVFQKYPGNFAFQIFKISQ